MQNSKFKMQNRVGNKKAFVLFIAIIVATVLLSIGVGIANFTLRELILTSTARNSGYAFYASDTGIECSYYWNNIFGNPNRGSVSSLLPVGESPDISGPIGVSLGAYIQCNDQLIYLTTDCPVPDPATGTYGCINADEGTVSFGFTLGDSGNFQDTPFADVLIDKSRFLPTPPAPPTCPNEDGDTSGEPRTCIASYGSNIHDQTSIRRVERALRSKF